MQGDELPLEGDEDPAAREFGKLRAEVTKLRADIARLQVAVQTVPKIDYSQTLGEMAGEQETIADRIDAVAKHTGANLPSGFFKAEVARGVHAGLELPAKLLHDTREALIRVTERITGEERALEEERRRWWWPVLGLGIVAGLAVMLIFVLAGVRHLPGSWGEGIAARAIGKAPAQAGAQMIEHDDPEQWRKLVEGYALREAGGKPLADCLARMERTHKPIVCRVTLSPKAN